MEINAPLARLLLRYLISHPSCLSWVLLQHHVIRHISLAINVSKCRLCLFAGHDHQYIADLLKVSVRQVGYAIHAERVTLKERTCRPRQLTNDQIDELVTHVGHSRASRQRSFAGLAEGPFSHWNVGEYVIRNALRSRRYVRRIARAKAPLSDANRQIRLAWAEEHVNRTQEE